MQIYYFEARTRKGDLVPVELAANDWQEVLKWLTRKGWAFVRMIEFS